MSTAEEGTVSGALDVAVDHHGRGHVRYHETDTWLTIGNQHRPSTRTWASVEELRAAIDAERATDTAGNTIPFGEDL
ncbi:hypothetical protein GS504_01245 [Rhodococcus hoagii]|nr:hypothetical protein [Prescottella equi]NKS71701.1 hypothetical protein [Prescottella equi]